MLSLFHRLRPSVPQLRMLSSQAASADRPSVIDRRQGEKHGALFSPKEMERRLSNLRQCMVEKEIDACVLTSYHNINYFSEYLYCAFGRPYALVVTMNGQTSVSAGIDFGQPWRKTYGDNITYTDWQKDNYFKAVKQLVGDKKRIGFEFDHVNLENYAKFQNTFPSGKFTDISEATMEMKLIKSSEEIEVIKNGARIADLGGETIRNVIREGISEYEVAMASTNAMIHEIANTYPQVDIMDTWTWFQSGRNTDGGHNPLTTRKLQKGDVLSLNCFPMIGGYYTALERTLFLEHASDKAIELWQANCDVHKRGLELLKPGAKISDIVSELNEIYKSKNLLQHRTFGYGHSFGVLCHYYGREAGLELREDNDKILEPNMVMSMQPSINIPYGELGEGGYKEHDILVLHADGAENITKFPFGPEHNIVKA